METDADPLPPDTFVFFTISLSWNQRGVGGGGIPGGAGTPEERCDSSGGAQHVYLHRKRRRGAARRHQRDRDKERRPRLSGGPKQTAAPCHQRGQTGAKLAATLSSSKSSDTTSRPLIPNRSLPPSCLLDPAPSPLMPPSLVVSSTFSLLHTLAFSIDC